MSEDLYEMIKRRQDELRGREEDWIDRLFRWWRNLDKNRDDCHSEHPSAFRDRDLGYLADVAGGIAMTNRRGFLGLLAAAPLVAPVVAKEMATASQTQQSVGGDALMWSRFVKVADSEWVEINLKPLGGCRAWTQTYSDQDCAISHWTGPDTPNRLYGARINSDGDAV